MAKALVHDGRNRLAADGAATLTHDAKGNVTAIGATGYTYSARNLQYTIPGGFLTYGPLGELDYVSGNTLNPNATLLDYSGQALTTEYAPGGAIVKRYVHGDGVDEPLVEYDGAGNRTWLHADERGSIVARSDASGAVTAINRYDDYGQPAAGNVGRFQYTGQTWLPELGMYYYKARMYAPQLGRFIQGDPIGYQGGMNLYAYVRGDPVNYTDPSGLEVCGIGEIEQINWSTDTRPLGPDEVRAGYTVKCLPDLNRWTVEPGGPLLPEGGGDNAGPPASPQTPQRQCTALQKMFELKAIEAEQKASTLSQISGGAAGTGLLLIQATRRLPSIAPATVRGVKPAVVVAGIAGAGAVYYSAIAIINRISSGDTVGAAFSSTLDVILGKALKPINNINRFSKDAGLGDILAGQGGQLYSAETANIGC